MYVSWYFADQILSFSVAVVDMPIFHFGSMICAILVTGIGRGGHSHTEILLSYHGLPCSPLFLPHALHNYNAL